LEIRQSFKKVRHFVDWEYKEKRPKSVKAFRVKSKSMFNMGVLPNFQMERVGPVVYLVVSDHIDTLTVYFFNKLGDKLGSEKYEPTPKFMKELQKSTIVKYQRPKKERKDIERYIL